MNLIIANPNELKKYLLVGSVNVVIVKTSTARKPSKIHLIYQNLRPKHLQLTFLENFQKKARGLNRVTDGYYDYLPLNRTASF